MLRRCRPSYGNVPFWFLRRFGYSEGSDGFQAAGTTVNEPQIAPKWGARRGLVPRAGYAESLLRGMGFAMRQRSFHWYGNVGWINFQDNAIMEGVNPLEQLRRCRGIDPVVDISCWIAPTAKCVGAVYMAPEVSVYYNTNVVADTYEVHIGARSVIQESCAIKSNICFPCRIGSDCIIEPNAVVIGTKIGDGVFIGAGALTLEGSTVSDYAILAPGAMLSRFDFVPTGELWAGNPACKVRDLTPEEMQQLKTSATHLQNLSMQHKHMCDDVYGDGSKVNEAKIVQEVWDDLIDESTGDTSTYQERENIYRNYPGFWHWGRDDIGAISGPVGHSGPVQKTFDASDQKSSLGHGYQPGSSWKQKGYQHDGVADRPFRHPSQSWDEIPGRPHSPSAEDRPYQPYDRTVKGRNIETGEDTHGGTRR